ncbi:MAG TPA: hypothetical protein VN889_05335 [Solirubrobacteraceae bacterium]|nr:hypothetical protein [Solirubrobacteraceae bacterium]
MNRLRSLGFKIYGEPPPKGAPRSKLLRWIRGFYFKLLPPMLVIYVLVVVVVSQTWVLIVLAASALIWLQGMISLSLRVRRAEHRETR